MEIAEKMIKILLPTSTKVCIQVPGLAETFVHLCNNCISYGSFALVLTFVAQ